MMTSDPNEKGERVKEFRKDAQDEKFFLDFNRHIESFAAPVDASIGDKYPTIYIVGLPRSGTTVLSQLVSRFLPVGYINNLIARFWLNPVIGIRLSQAVLGQYQRQRIALTSTHGVTEEPWGPHEFGYFWRHWLHLDDTTTHKLPPDILARIDRKGLCAILGGMVAAFQAPLVFKNIICGLQASLLSQIRPNSLFVMIERDPQEVASSILRVRRERYGSDATWWSLKPSTYPEISCLGDPVEQVRRQVLDGTREFRDELAKPGVTSISVSYEALCADPSAVLAQISEAASRFGVSLSIAEHVTPLVRVSSARSPT